jgi:multidrug transporter EmrE-like cation transporter
MDEQEKTLDRKFNSSTSQTDDLEDAMLERLQEQTWVTSLKVETQARFLHRMTWVAFWLATVFIVGATTRVMGETSGDVPSQIFYALLGCLGVFLTYVFAVVADLFANRSRLHGLQGQIDAVRMYDDIDDD